MVVEGLGVLFLVAKGDLGDLEEEGVLGVSAVLEVKQMQRVIRQRAMGVTGIVSERVVGQNWASIY